MKKLMILSKDDAIKLCDSISRAGTKLANDIQSLVLTAVGYANVHGDVTIATRLIGSLNAGTRKQAVVNVCEAFGCLAYDSKAKQFNHVKRDDVERDPAALVVLFSKPENFWTTYTPEPEVLSNYDVKAAVESLIKRLARMEKSGTQLEHREMFATLTEMVEAAE